MGALCYVEMRVKRRHFVRPIKVSLKSVRFSILFRSHLFVSTCLITFTLTRPAASASDSALTFYVPFDGTPTAAVCLGGRREPTVARGLRYVEGVSGRAVYVGGFGERRYDRAPLLEYDAGQHFASGSGTVSFWVRPEWDGYFDDPRRFDWHFLFYAMGGKTEPDFTSAVVDRKAGYQRIALFMWNWLRCDLAADKKAMSIKWRCRNAWMRGDWWHVALSWDKRGWAKLYVNGSPECVTGRVQLADTQRFYVGCLAKVWPRRWRANAAFDELRIFRRALTDEEVMQQFRRFAPVDFSVERRYLRAGVSESLLMDLMPGRGVATPVAGKLRVQVLADSDGRVCASDNIPLGLSKRRTITFPLAPLVKGNYRVTCVLTTKAGRWQRSFPLVAYEQRTPSVASAADVVLGKEIVSIDCTKTDHGYVESTRSPVKTVLGVGTYREAGKGKWDRFGFEVEIPGADGSPVALDITWPDDKERAMAFYMIVKSDRKQHRDRLSGGVQCGGEYPNSNAMKTTRYLFYPQAEHYLFEVRTLIPGMPAAVSKLTIHRLRDRLPKLRIRRPAWGEPRAFGHLDEDQSFEILLHPRRITKLRYGYPIEVFERLLDYMDYTGQNVISYSVLRYTWDHLDDGPVNVVEGGMRTTGWLALLLDMMEKRGQQFIANVHLFSVPPPQAGASPEQIETRKRNGHFLVDRNGLMAGRRAEQGFGNNPVHPAVRARFMELIGEIVRRFGKHPAFRGIDLWCDRRSPFLFPSLDVGYGDVTVAQFERDTGCKVPRGKNSLGRFDARYRYLTGPKRAQWLAWRARKTTELIQEIDAVLRRTRPDLKLYLSVGGWYSKSPEFLDQEQCEDFDFREFAYETLSLDMGALKRIPAVVLVPMKDGTYYRWLKHWYAGRETIIGELNASVDKFRAFRNGERSATSIYLRYFESFMNSLKPDVYQTYFQNADPKAYGRYFLKDFALAMAAQDPAQILIGAQPLGTSGRDAQAREFAQAFRALPVGDFRDVPGLDDPVTVRFLNTPKGTYLYAVNLIHCPVVLRLDLRGTRGEIVDLSTGASLARGGNRVVVDLKPFQLRSFLWQDRRGLPSGGEVSVPASSRAWYAARVAEIESAIHSLEASGAVVVPHRKRLAAIKRELARGHHAEAHRLIFSKLMREMSVLREAAAKGYLRDQAAMIARSEYAVNCGSRTFYRTHSGKLFFPDRKYTPGGYGYDGAYRSVSRPVAGLKRPDRVLFATEAYDIDAYRFTVKPGLYTVRLYCKVGYRHSARPGVFVFNVAIEGKTVLSDYDVFVAAGGDSWKAVDCEIKGVKVDDGVLDIEFSLPPDKALNPTARLCNAIEVVPEQ